MPIYEYTCSKCDHRFDQLVRTMTESGRIKCPSCGSTRTARALSVFAVGAESSRASSSATAPGMCGRCNGDGPCPMD